MPSTDELLHCSDKPIHCPTRLEQIIPGASHDGPHQVLASEFTYTVPVPRKTLKVAIVGKAPASQQLAPYGDESWEIWSLSDAPKEIPRWSRHFELHDIEGNTAGDPRTRKDKWGPYWEFLKKDHGKPVYIQRPHPEVPHGIVFPMHEVKSAFPAYFTNTVSWLIAYAICIGCQDDESQPLLTDLALYGVDMAQHGIDGRSEYAHQRPSCEFFLGIAAGKGIRVHVPDSSDLLKARRLYAFDSDGGEFAAKMKARRKELHDQQQSSGEKRSKIHAEIAALQKKDKELENRQYALAGAVDNLDWVHEWH